ncbi:MAG TPA: hypothetical protein VJM09_07665 [Sphingobium sp.]|nr:hypothetical protein [Sphingobium sp.]
MEQDRKSDRSSEQAAEGRDDAPPPERGSPQQAKGEQEHGPAEERVEKGVDKDPNPLAPPVNTQGGS